MGRDTSNFRSIEKVEAHDFFGTVERYLLNERDLEPIKSSWYMALDPCVYCGGVADTWDHLDALVLGGKNRAENVARACEECNQEKGRMTVLLYLASRASPNVGEYRHDILFQKLASTRKRLLYALERLLVAKGGAIRPQRRTTRTIRNGSSPAPKARMRAALQAVTTQRQ